jgi:hypothetical protein
MAMLVAMSKSGRNVESSETFSRDAGSATPERDFLRDGERDLLKSYTDLAVVGEPKRS